MKYRIKDEDGLEYEVSEINSDEVIDDEPVDKAQLLPEEIEALKRLAAIADKLIALIDETPVQEDDACGGDVNEDEKLIDTKTGDSKKSFGAIEVKKTRDSNEELEKQIEIEQAWAKRYGGNK